MAKSKITSIQVFRGCAALVVVAHHAALSTDAFVKRLPESIKTLFDLGHLGVDFFFVLSGFIIMYAHSDDVRSASSLKSYIFKRLSRIYPAYWPVGVAMVALYALMPGFSAAGERGYSLLSSLLLLPAAGPPALSVAWTLVHELMFYCVFLLFFISGRWLAVGLGCWAILILYANYYGEPTGWLRYPLSLLNIEFMLGVVAACLTRVPSLRGRGGWVAGLGFAIVLCALWLIVFGSADYFRLLLAAGLALVIVGFAVYEQSKNMYWPAVLLVMGNASYSIYLIHNPLLSITQRLAGRIGIGWELAMIMGVALSVLAGWLYYRIVERPTLQFFQRKLRK
jgi:peptidoglycan/LPS O-acetylase OafA/YrhL